MSDVVQKTVIGPVSQERLAVQRAMQSAAIGQIVSWETLESLTTVPRARVYGFVRDAARALEREHKMHFVVRRGVGVERVDHADVARETLPKMRGRVAGAARSMVRTTRNLVLDDMPVAERTSVLLHQTIGELTVMACSNQSMKQLEAQADKDKFLTPLSPKQAMAKLLAG